MAIPNSAPIDSVPALHVGDVGTIVRATVVEKVWDPVLQYWVDTPVDISNATVMELGFILPSGKVRIRPAVHTTDGADGKVQYVTQAGDLSEVGTPTKPWRVQAYVEQPGKKHTTDTRKFVVKPAIPRPEITLTPDPLTLTLAQPAPAIS